MKREAQVSAMTSSGEEVREGVDSLRRGPDFAALPLDSEVDRIDHTEVRVQALTAKVEAQTVVDSPVEADVDALQESGSGRAAEDHEQTEMPAAADELPVTADELPAAADSSQQGFEEDKVPPSDIVPADAGDAAREATRGTSQAETNPQLEATFNVLMDRLALRLSSIEESQVSRLSAIVEAQEALRTQ